MLKITEFVDAQVKDVLDKLRLGKYYPIFVKKEVDYEAFLRLTKDDLDKTMDGSGIQIGPKKNIVAEIERLNKAAGTTMTGKS